MNTEIQLHKASPAALAAAESAKARIQSAYTLALHRPRNVDQSRERILAACKRPRFAEKVEYSKPQGKSHIKGPSVRLAELALREWGNVLIDIQTVHEDESVRRIKVYITDMETNTTFSKEITVAKTVERKNKAGREVVSDRTNSYGETVYVVIATDDELATKEAALVSKVVRNEGLRIIPQDIVEEALDVARETLSKGAKDDPEGERRKILDAFAGLGIKPKDLALYLGHGTERIDPSEILELRKVYQAIRDGESKWADYLPEKEEPKGFELAGDDNKKPETKPETKPKKK